MLKPIVDKLLEWVGVGGAIAILLLSVGEWLLFDLTTLGTLNRQELAGAVFANFLIVVVCRYFWRKAGGSG